MLGSPGTSTGLLRGYVLIPQIRITYIPISVRVSAKPSFMKVNRTERSLKSELCDEEALAFDAIHRAARSHSNYASLPVSKHQKRHRLNHAGLEKLDGTRIICVPGEGHSPEIQCWQKKIDPGSRSVPR